MITAEVVTSVDEQTGEVSFTDSEGKVLLRKEQGGKREFWPLTVEGDKGYSFRQVFESINTPPTRVITYDATQQNIELK